MVQNANMCFKNVPLSRKGERIKASLSIFMSLSYLSVGNMIN